MVNLLLLKEEVTSPLHREVHGVSAKERMRERESDSEWFLRNHIWRLIG